MPANVNVWAQMNYTPPRGPCNFKQGVLSPRCPCLRFMLHPLKVGFPIQLLLATALRIFGGCHAHTQTQTNAPQSTSSFECDGCAHHSSFHSMENKAEDEIRKRWELEAREKKDDEEQARPRKRVRALEYGGSTEDAARRTGRAGTRTGTRGRVTDVVEDEVVEVD